MIPIANILLAVDLIAGLSKRVIAYRDSIQAARAEGRDLTDSELDALSEEAGQALDLARARIEAAE